MTETEKQKSYSSSNQEKNLTPEEYHAALAAKCDHSGITADKYRVIARKHGLPDGLIEAVIKRWGANANHMEFWGDIAKRTTSEFWSIASEACQNELGAVGYLTDLNDILAHAGNDAYNEVTTAEQIDRKGEILKAIANLDALLRQQRTGDTYQYETRYPGDEQLAISLLSYSKESGKRANASAMLNAFEAGDASLLTVGDLLECLKNAVKQDYQNPEMTVIPDSRPRPQFDSDGDQSARIRWMCQQILAWFYQFSDTAPKHQIVQILEATALAMSFDQAVYNSADTLYGTARRKLKKATKN